MFNVVITFNRIEALDIPVMDPSLLTFGGKADPYIIFTTDPSEMMHRGKKKSPVLMRTQSPVWTHKIVLQLRVNNYHSLDSTHLRLAFKDYDLASNDDSIGVAVLSIGGMIWEQNRYGSFSFRQPIIRHGLPRGVVSGTGEITLPEVQTAVSTATQGCSTRCELS